MNGKWTICVIGLNKNCRLDIEVYQQDSVSSEPLSGSQHWRKYRHGTNTYTYSNSNIQIQALKSCDKHGGFMIYYEPSAVTRIVSQNFKDCKDRAEKSSSGPVLFLSFTSRYNNNRPRCLFSHNTPKIIKETTVLSTLFIEIKNVEIENTATTTTRTSATPIDIDHPSLNKTDEIKIVNTTSSTERITGSDDQKIQLELYIGIGVLVLLILLVIALAAYICKIKGSSTIITENQSYGEFSDFEEYYKDNKDNIITDRNDYY